LASQVIAPAGGKTVSPDRALHIPVSGPFCFFLLLVLFEFGVEVAYNNRSVPGLLATDSQKLFSSPQRAHGTVFVKRDKPELAFWLVQHAICRTATSTWSGRLPELSLPSLRSLHC